MMESLDPIKPNEIKHMGQHALENANNTSDDGTSGLDWKDGIGTLPGSDLKFRKNEFGVIELIMDDVHSVVTKEANVEVPPPPQVNGIGVSESKNVGDAQALKTELNGNLAGNAELTPGSVAPSGHARTAAVTGELKQEFSSQSFGNVKEEFFAENQQDLNGAAPASLKLDVASRADRREAQTRGFTWQEYLQRHNAQAAPISAFEEITGRPALPTSSNRFAVGDLLEAVDPMHQSLFCVVSVVEIKGYRMRLHFEGYSTLHDFWVNANDRLIFPCGFSKKSGRRLQLPKGHSAAKFMWRSYAKAMGKNLASEENFPEDRNKYFENNTKFTIGNKLEAVDRQNPELTCVATVTDIIDEKILIHFDGWNHNFDYWCDSTSNYIHPLNWCKSAGKTLAVPQDCGEAEEFVWEEYLKKAKSTAAPKEAFQPRVSHGLDVGMKLEIVDKRNQILVRVASIVEKSAYQVKIHFDGWDQLYDYWIDVDSTDLHPAGWCAQTGHLLQPNISEEEKQPWRIGWQSGCPIPGCRGMGHIKGSKFVGHHSEYGCPYSVKNLDSYPIQDRVTPRRGPKPSAMMIRRMMPPPPGKEKASTNENNPEPKRVPSLRRASRNSLTGGRRSSQESDQENGNQVMTNHTGEPPAKRRNSKQTQDEVRTEKRDLRYSTLNSILWSAVPNKHLAIYWEQCTRLLPGMMVESGVDNSGYIYRGTLPNNYFQVCCDHFTGMRNVKASQICKWSSKEVANFVEELTGQEKYGRLFLKEEIDGEAFLLLTQNDIFKVLNIKFGPTLKIHGAILYAKVND